MIQQHSQTIGDLECVVVQAKTCQSPQAVVILCHGFGAPATDLVSIAPEFIRLGGALAEVAYVFPAAPIELDPLFDARAWWPIDMEKIQQLMMSGQTREMKGTSPERLPMRRVSMTKVIDHCRLDHALPASKIIVGGFSQGSMLSTDVALHYPEALGGLVIWSGSLICEKVWMRQAKQQAPLKIVQSHGRLDPILPMTGAEDLRDMLVAAGHEVRFHEFGGQHSIPLEAIELSVQLINDVASDGPA